MRAEEEHPSKSKLDPKDGAKGMAKQTEIHTHMQSISLHTSHTHTCTHMHIYGKLTLYACVCSKYTLRNAKKGNNKKFF